LGGKREAEEETSAEEAMVANRGSLSWTVPSTRGRYLFLWGAGEQTVPPSR